MSMLAGPRRKQKVINLRAKNNEWSNDKNKFGQRMLEKMGWSEGKGLGANENGIVEHVIARYKNDDRGLGYVDRNDQWTKHEDDFNALLANLSNSSDQNQSQEVLHSGKSLETKSKKSKARIHYHKFTRGKDIARYSEKDLANIFGKKTLKPNENEEPPKEEDDKEKVFTEKGSMYDYFKNKMAGVKNMGSKLLEVNNDDDDEEILDHSFKGFSNSNASPQGSDKEETKKAILFSFYPQMSENVSNNQIDTSNGTEESQTRKKKKKTKQKDVSDTACDHEIPEDSNQKKKESKKRFQEEPIEQEEQVVKKKKKKDKMQVQQTEESVEVPHKKKKKKNKNNDL